MIENILPYLISMNKNLKCKDHKIFQKNIEKEGDLISILSES